MRLGGEFARVRLPMGLVRSRRPRAIYFLRPRTVLSRAALVVVCVPQLVLAAARLHMGLFMRLGALGLRTFPGG